MSYITHNGSLVTAGGKYVTGPVPTGPYITSAYINILEQEFIRVAFSDNLDPVYMPNASAFSVSDVSVKTVIDVSMSYFTNEILIYVDPIFYFGETNYTLDYTAPATNYLRDLSGQKVKNVVNYTITNNLSRPPEIKSIYTYDNSLNKIYLGVSETISGMGFNDNYIPDTSAFIATNRYVIDISFGYNNTSEELHVIILTLDSSYNESDISNIAVSYIKPSQNFIRTTKDDILQTFYDASVNLINV